uniref:General transcription factor IIH subunit 3 n=1 Tax=Loa loa TaxID=7209 RepID=A0A1I7VTL0_LOALO
MSCLSIVLDCDARHWGELAEKGNNENVICTLIHSITSYTTAHMSLSAANRIIVIGADGTLSEPTIYATNTSIDIDMNSAVKTAVRNALKKSASSTNTTESAVFAPAVAIAICHIFRYKNEVDNGDGRILIINIGSDLRGEHSILMNIFFAAHKHNILIDVANIGEASTILQQASDITGGTYFSVKKPKQLLKYTMCFTLGKASLRSAFPSPSSSTSVDYRASCHCHGAPVSIGWVCSVCLSVQCHFNPICPACNTVFKISTLARRGRKKRREGN